jgi:simple sugar transport system ATP-binding protein
MPSPDGAPSRDRAPVVLRLEHVGVRDALGVARLHDVSLAVQAGEIVGVAAVEGAGHHELLRVLAGRLPPASGAAALPDDVGFVPEDRHRDALVLEMPLPENVALRGAGRRRGRVSWRAEAERTRAIVERGDVRAPGMDARAASLSGGNQQKLVLGRELWGDPAALVAESPTRGLDVRAAAAVLAALRTARARGAAVVVYSSDLDELLAIADRIVVVHAGRVREVARTRDAIGRAMVGADGVAAGASRGEAGDA